MPVSKSRRQIVIDVHSSPFLRCRMCVLKLRTPISASTLLFIPVHQATSWPIALLPNLEYVSSVLA